MAKWLSKQNFWVCGACGTLLKPLDNFCSGCDSAIGKQCPECKMGLPARHYGTPQYKIGRKCKTCGWEIPMEKSAIPKITHKFFEGYICEVCKEASIPAKWGVSYEFNVSANYVCDSHFFELANEVKKKYPAQIEVESPDNRCYCEYKSDGTQAKYKNQRECDQCAIWTLYPVLLNSNKPHYVCGEHIESLIDQCKEEPMPVAKKPEALCNCLFCKEVSKVSELASVVKKNGVVATPKPKFKPRPIRDFITQKVKGLEELSTARTASRRITVIKFLAFQSEKDITDGKAEIEYTLKKPYFARPCPVVPRHGFVDSRKAESVDEVLSIFNEARKADDKAEILVCNFIPAKCNAIWTNGLLTIGPGNDGATGGRESFVLPTIDRDPIKRSDCVWASIKHSAFYELVSEGVVSGTDEKIWLTQLRDGPIVPKTVDFIPARMRVEKIVKAEGDLLEWEEKAASFGPGTVVWHPGGSLSSHYAIHCQNHNIPVLVSRKPKVGDDLEPNTKVNDIDLGQFVEGVICGVFQTDISPYQAVRVMLGILHNSVAFDRGNPLQARFLGLACGLAVKLGFVASIGEDRHAKTRRYITHDRQELYDIFWDDFVQSKKKIPQALEDFHNDSLWSDRGCYGGPAWAGCLEETIALWNSLCECANGKDSVVTAIDHLNKIINKAHNNGRFLNKFAGEATFTEAASEPSRMLVENIYSLFQASRITPASMVTKFKQQIGVALNSEEEEPKKVRAVKRAATIARRNMKELVKGTFVPIEFQQEVPPSFTVEHVQANIRDCGNTIHFQYTVSGKNMGDGYKTLACLLSKEVLAAMIWRSEDYHPLLKSMSGSPTQYVQFLVKENRYFVIWNKTLGRFITACDLSEYEAGCLNHYLYTNKKWDKIDGKYIYV